jgi:hypothetical protein
MPGVLGCPSLCHRVLICLGFLGWSSRLVPLAAPQFQVIGGQSRGQSVALGPAGISNIGGHRVTERIIGGRRLSSEHHQNAQGGPEPPPPCLWPLPRASCVASAAFLCLAALFVSAHRTSRPDRRSKPVPSTFAARSFRGLAAPFSRHGLPFNSASATIARMNANHWGRSGRPAFR